MAGIRIETPRGCVYTGKNGKARLEWNENFAAQRSEAFTRAQKYVDSEVLRLTAPYIPMKTGMLIKSGTLGTEIGSGEVNYIAPYAAKQYATSPTRSYNARRGGLFFERMKADHQKEIIAGAKRLSGGK